MKILFIKMICTYLTSKYLLLPGSFAVGEWTPGRVPYPGVGTIPAGTRGDIWSWRWPTIMRKQSVIACHHVCCFDKIIIGGAPNKGLLSPQ